MSKERLKEIEERVLVDKVYYKYLLGGTKGHWSKVYTLSEEDYNYLKEQAERVQELEEERERYQSGRNIAVKTKMKMDELEKQNKRYREALEFYADRENYEPEHYDPDTHDYTSMIGRDRGATARKALEGGE